MKSARAIVLCGTLALVGLAVLMSQSLPAQQSSGAVDDAAGVVGESDARVEQGGIGQAGPAAGGEQLGERSTTGDQVVPRANGGANGIGVTTQGDSGAVGFQNQPGVQGGTEFQAQGEMTQQLPARRSYPRAAFGQFGESSGYYNAMAQSAADPLRNSDAQLERQSQELAGKYARTEDDEARRTLRGELGEVIAHHFDVRYEIRWRELREIEARVNRLRNALERRQNAREEIIQRRLAQLLSEAEGVGF